MSTRMFEFTCNFVVSNAFSEANEGSIVPVLMDRHQRLSIVIRVFVFHSQMRMRSVYLWLSSQSYSFDGFSSKVAGADEFEAL
jgi:aromatic ring-cleaving dioxygenase